MPQDAVGGSLVILFPLETGPWVNKRLACLTFGVPGLYGHFSGTHWIYTFSGRPFQWRSKSLDALFAHPLKK